MKSEKIDEDDDHSDDHDNDNDYLDLYFPDLTSCHVSMTRSSSRETKCSRCNKHLNQGIYPVH